MKFGFRMPSFKARLSARASPARFLRHSLVSRPREVGDGSPTLGRRRTTASTTGRRSASARGRRGGHRAGLDALARVVSSS